MQLAQIALARPASALDLALPGASALADMSIEQVDA
jgi:hypothetical protein